MGYGLDTTKYGDRKWGTTITWSGEAKGKLADGLLAWQNAVGVTFVHTNGTGDFTVDIRPKKKDGKTKWDNGKGSKGNGKPPNGAKGILYLKTDSSLGTAIHEIGHLLGLSHEQDHPDYFETWYDENSISSFTKSIELYGQDQRAKSNCKYGDYDSTSVMHYPDSQYGSMTAPSAGDIAAVKAINGW